MTTDKSDLLAASLQLAQAADQLIAIANGQQVKNCFYGIWVDQPEMIDPTFESINHMIRTAKTLIS